MAFCRFISIYIFPKRAEAGIGAEIGAGVEEQKLVDIRVLVPLPLGKASLASLFLPISKKLRQQL